MVHAHSEECAAPAGAEHLQEVPGGGGAWPADRRLRAGAEAEAVENGLLRGSRADDESVPELGGVRWWRWARSCAQKVAELYAVNGTFYGM